ncbi:hypothetical protein J4457_01235 [Candidatus Woesearchaeota archaeon]|nr:hypothetical protein [Candidatus Woesearchaeota archaeon]
MKRHLIATLLLFAALLCAPVLAQSLPITINNVQVDDVEVIANQANSLDIERGQTVEVEVRFSPTADIDDLQLQGSIYGFEYNDFLPMTDTLAPFDADANVTYVKKLHIKISDEVEEDRYNLRLIFADRNSDLLISNYPLKLDVPRDSLQVEDIVTFPSQTVQAGRALLVTVRLENKGEKDQDDVRVETGISQLGVSNVDFIDEIESEEEEETEEILLQIPACAESGKYELQVKVYYDEGYETVTESVPVNVVGGESCPTNRGNQRSGQPSDKENEPQTMIIVGSQLETLKQGGEGVIYPITLTNNGRSSATYTLMVQGVTFGEVRVSPTSTIVLESGASQTLYVFIKANKDASLGPNVFTASVVSAGTTLNQVSLTANVVEGDASSLQTVLEVGLIVLVIVLILVALVVAFRKGKGDEEDQDDVATTETYY